MSIIGWLGLDRTEYRNFPFLPPDRADEEITIGRPPYLFLFAVPHGNEEQRLYLGLESDETFAVLPEFSVRPASSQCSVEVRPGKSGRMVRVCVIVKPAEQPAEDDELLLDLEASGGVPPCRIVVRRTKCHISTTLVDRRGKALPLLPQTRATLLWQGWKRYQELIVTGRDFFLGYSHATFRLVSQPPIGLAC